MKTVNSSRYLSCKHQFATLGLDDAFYNSRLIYSIMNLSFTGTFSPELIIEALQKSLEICNLLGVNTRHHFKKVYIYDEQMGVLRVDWLMSKNGFNLVVMQLPASNEKMARWLWALSDF